jgi:cyclase
MTTTNPGPPAVRPAFGRTAVRLIARLDIKGPNLVKGIHLEGLRIIGDPAEHAIQYYRDGADELIYVDTVASLYGRNNLVDVVAKTAEQIYIPLTVGGGIRSIEDIHRLLRAGADKVSINTAATKDPTLITRAAEVFGSQCIVLSVQAKRRPGGGWEAYTDNGRETTGMDAVEWACRGVELGAGEVLLTSVDREGTRKGFDLELVAQIGRRIPVPLVAAGGAGEIAHLDEVLSAGADALAVASLLHYKTETVASIKRGLAERGCEVRAV